MVDKNQPHGSHPFYSTLLSLRESIIISFRYVYGKERKLSVVAAGNNISDIIIYEFGSIDYIHAFTAAITDSFFSSQFLETRILIDFGPVSLISISFYNFLFGKGTALTCEN